MQLNLKPKQPVRVRDCDGVVKNAFYGGRHITFDGKIKHMVFVEDEAKIADSYAPRKAIFPEFYDRVRFVYPIEQMENYKAKSNDTKTAV